jgi:hypothetical protein
VEIFKTFIQFFCVLHMRKTNMVYLFIDKNIVSRDFSPQG